MSVSSMQQTTIARPSPGRTFLLTNRHNARDRHNVTDQILSPTGAEPDELLVLQNVTDKPGNWVSQILPLRDENNEPTWREHPSLGGQIDAVALDVGDMSGFDVYAYEPRMAGPQMAFGPSTPLSIVGFPFGLTGGLALGVWIQGSAATEPAIDWNDLPCFLIDSRTRPGQSGSPVLIYREGGASTMDDGSTFVSTAARERFLGIYSGRINPESDLGIVWKASAVAEIVDAAVGANQASSEPPASAGS